MPRFDIVNQSQTYSADVVVLNDALSYIIVTGDIAEVVMREFVLHQNIERFRLILAAPMIAERRTQVERLLALEERALDEVTRRRPHEGEGIF